MNANVPQFGLTIPQALVVIVAIAFIVGIFWIAIEAMTDDAGIRCGFLARGFLGISQVLAQRLPAVDGELQIEPERPCVNKCSFRPLEQASFFAHHPRENECRNVHVTGHHLAILTQTALAMKARRGELNDIMPDERWNPMPDMWRSIPTRQPRARGEELWRLT